MLERILIRLLALSFIIASFVHVADGGETKVDELSHLYFVKCVAEKKDEQTQGIYLLDGFRFEVNSPLIMQVVLGSQKAKDYRVTQFRKVLGAITNYYELIANAADGNRLELNISERGQTTARHNQDKLRPQLVCKVGRS